MKHTILVGDGAMGTMLQAAGLPVGEPPEKWNIAKPQLISEVHRLYLEAGAEVIETNTFGGNRYKLRKIAAQEAWQMNLAGAVLAKEAAGAKTLVAGSMGPTGILLAPWGEASFHAVVDAFAQQALALAAGGADLILVETMTDLQEARAAVFGALSSDIPVAVQFTFETTGHTLMGTPPDVAAAIIQTLGPIWVGCNCGTGPEAMLEPIRQMSPWARELAVFPNAGLPQWQHGREIYPLDPEGFAFSAQRLVNAGVSLVGGCCGTTPAHIRILRAYRDSSFASMDPHDRLQQMVLAQSERAALSGQAEWVIGEETSREGVFLASRTTLFPIATEGIHYELERVGSIVDFEPDDWTMDRGSLGSLNVRVPIIDIPHNLEANQIASLVAELQVRAMPVVFGSESPHQLKEALFNYCGRAGVLIPTNNTEAFVETAVAMGALPIYR